MKKHIRFALGVFLLVFTFNAVGLATSIGVVSQAHAAPVGPDIGSIDKQVQTQYFARVAMRVMFDDGAGCFQARPVIGKEWKSTPNDNDDDNSFGYIGPLSATSDPQRVGSLFKSNGGTVASGDDLEIDCNSPEDLKIVLSALGYSSYSAWIADIYDCEQQGNGCSIRQENGTAVSGLTVADGTSGNANAMKYARARTLAHVKNEKLGGAGGELRGDFTDPIRYWYYNKIFRQSACKGIFKLDTTDLPDTNHYKIDSNKPWVWIDDKGIANTNWDTMITRGDELRHSIEGLNNYGNQINGNAWCERIGDMIKPSYATAYQREFVIPALQKAASAEVNAKCNPISGANEKIKCYADAGVAPTGTMQPPEVADTDVDPCQASGLTLSWLVCGVIDVLDTAVSWFGDRLTKLLNFSLPADTATNSSSDAYPLYKSWTAFRSIANVLLIIIFLIIILSQIISIESLSAYTVKKAITRLVIASIVVQLSGFVTVWIVGLIQALGDVSKDLILAPFTSSLKDLTFTSGESLVTFVGGGIGFVASGIGVWGAMGSAFLAILFAVLAAFFVVLVRRLVIIACIVMAPIAFIAWILPNTQPLFKMWWSFLTKTLLMYPLIVMLLASGRIASSLLISGVGSAHAGLSITGLFQQWSVAPWAQVGAQDVDVFTKLAAVIAYFAPYAMIPLTFKFAGGLISNVGGMVNDRSRGILDGRRKRNAEGNALRRQANATGTRFRESKNNYAAKAFNRVSGGIGVGARGGFGMSTRGRQQFAIRRAAFQEGKLQDASWVMAARNDDVARAGTYGSFKDAKAGLTDHFKSVVNDDGTRKYTDQEAEDKAVQTAKMASGTVGFGNGQAAFKQMLSNGTAFTDAADVAATIERVAGGDKDTEAHLLGYSKANQKSVMRHELSGADSGLVEATRKLRMAKKKGEGVDEAQAEVTRLTHKAHLEGAKSLDSYSLGKLKGASVKNLSASATHELEQARTQGVNDDTRLAAAVLQDIEQSSAQGTLGNALDAEKARTGVEQVKSGPGAVSAQEIEAVESGVLTIRDGGRSAARRNLTPQQQAELQAQEMNDHGPSAN